MRGSVSCTRLTYLAAGAQHDKTMQTPTPITVARTWCSHPARAHGARTRERSRALTNGGTAIGARACRVLARRPRARPVPLRRKFTPTVSAPADEYLAAG
eukprot:1326551-Prymnesium_polylepis.2